jgi:hypothetical protein
MSAAVNVSLTRNFFPSRVSSSTWYPVSALRGKAAATPSTLEASGQAQQAPVMMCNRVLMYRVQY